MRYVMALALVLGACGETEVNPELAEMEEVFRAGAFPSPPNYPGNGNIAIYEGDSATSEDCLIYTTVGTDVHQGSASGPAIMRIQGNSILDPATNQVMCSRDGNELVDRVRAGGPDGPVLFTVMGRWVFDGEINIAGKTWSQLIDYFDDKLLYTFVGPYIFEHAPFDGEILATSTKPIAQASQMRRLVITSLVAGECGGLGLYAEEGEDDDPHPQ
jgi:hypothetical protein